jgi:hypothetical protein
MMLQADRVKSNVVLASDLTDQHQAQMYEVYAKYYDTTTFEIFKKDLSEKTHVIIFTHHGRIIGFATKFLKEIPELGKGLFLFSGDTVMEQEYWGSKKLQKAFFWFTLRERLRRPFTPFYWMLISKGFKTYKMMRNNYPISYPQYKKPTPPEFQRRMDQFYAGKFGESYRPELGLIIFDFPSAAVKGDIAKPREKDLVNPDISYFLEKNPDYQKGVELACITEIRKRDFLTLLLKYAYYLISGK